MLIKNHKIYEDFIDNAEKDELVHVESTVEPEEEHEIKYAIYAPIRPKASLSKMLKKAADSFLEVKYSEVQNYTTINLAEDIFELDNDDKFGVNVCLLFDADFKSPKRTMRFILAITKIFYMERKTIQITAQSKSGITMYAFAKDFVDAFLRPKEMLEELNIKRLNSVYQNMTYGLNVFLHGRYKDCMLFTANELELLKSIPEKIPHYYSNNLKAIEVNIDVSNLTGNPFNQLSFEAKQIDQYGNEWLAIPQSIFANVARENLYPKYAACFLSAGRGFAPKSGLRDNIQDKLKDNILTVQDPHLCVTPYKVIRTARIVFSCFLKFVDATEHPNLQDSGLRRYAVYGVFKRMIESQNFDKQLILIMNDLTDCFGLSLSQRKDIEDKLETIIKKEWN